MAGFTTSPPDSQDLDALDPTTGHVRSLADLARAAGRHMEDRAGGPTSREDRRLNRLAGRYEHQMGRMGAPLSPEDQGRLHDALRDNPDWDIHDLLEHYGGRQIAVLGVIPPDDAQEQ